MRERVFFNLDDVDSVLRSTLIRESIVPLNYLIFCFLHKKLHRQNHSRRDFRKESPSRFLLYKAIIYLYIFVYLHNLSREGNRSIGRWIRYFDERSIAS